MSSSVPCTPQRSPTAELLLVSHARHIILPFDLRNRINDVYDDEKRQFLCSIFPGTTGISCDEYFVILMLRTLPPTPWPLTIGGVPLHLILDSDPNYPDRPVPPLSPIPLGKRVGSRNGSIANEQNGRNVEDWEPLFHVIKDHMEGLGISITEVIYWGDFFTIVLEHRDTDMTKVPHRAGKIICSYLFEDEMGRPLAPQARRLIDPAPGNPDTSKYTTLQPGLRVSSSYLPSSSDAFLSTTSGVLLRDQVGNEFMTVASHGFPAECGTEVFHASPSNGRKIGEFIYEASHTDIALVKLRDTEKFSNVTFQNNDIGREQIQLRKLASAIGRQRFEPIFLDSPDTGLIEGLSMQTSFVRVPTNDNSPKQQWLFTTWNYMGQDSATNLPEGMRGSAIWNNDGDVLGFFRYAPVDGVMSNWCSGIAADELIKRGFTLVDTSDRT